MKINKNYVLREVAGTWVVLSIGEATAHLSGMITLNETGVFLWRKLEEGATCEQLAEALTEEYSVSKEEALADVQSFVETLKGSHCIDE